jgi:AraC-like DNA-binding protein
VARALRISADLATDARAFDHWREHARTLHGVTEEWNPRSEVAFRGEAEIGFLGPFRRVKARSSSVTSHRSERNISDCPHGAYLIIQEAGKGSLFESRRDPISLERGDLLVVNFDRPLVSRALNGFAHDMLVLPKHLVDPHLPAGRTAHLQRISGRQGVEALASTLYGSIVREWDNIGADQITTVADALGRLIGVACGAAAGENPDAVAAGRLARAETFVAAHLSDPSLSAATAAASLKISVRTLYGLYEKRGASFAALVRRRRLDECRTALIAQPSRSITDIALAWGFGSVPSFYRAFQGAYGLAPGELREAALKADRDAENAQTEKR